MSSQDSKQAKGGRSRARSLSKKRRSEIATSAAAARWGVPMATHDGPLSVGDIVLDCAVLENGDRVISQTKFMEAMGIYYSGWLASARSADESTAELPLHLPFKKLKPFVDRHLSSLQVEGVRYRTREGRSVAKGILAETLPKICEVWLDARAAGVLTKRQEQIATKAEILIRGFAHVGIVALVDEATGYQYERQRDALQELLEEILSASLRRWVRTFPPAYFRELCRLRGVAYQSNMKLPPYFGHLTNDIVYSRLAPGVLDELRERNPSNGGRRKACHHQWLSDDVGHPRLLHHLGAVVGLMKISHDWETFKRHLDVAAPTYSELPLFAAEAAANVALE